MAINSIAFIVFVAIVCLCYFILPKKIKWIVLLVASYFFYLASSMQWSIFMIITTISIYYAALKMGKIDEITKKEISGQEKEIKKQIKEKAKKKKKVVIILTLLLNFGILVILKYGNFLGSNLNGIFSLFHTSFQIPIVQFVLPLGISYYTLQATSYVIDVYRGKYKPEKNLGKVALFVSFFPQIVEGPIGRFDRLAEQLYKPHEFDYTRVKFGIQLMAWGFFKKMVIADRAALFVDSVFASYACYSGVIIVLAIILYTIQIYAEFSGCMDIVRGVAQILGIQLDKNFERPFFSKSVQEFWRRWNITLGTWLKEYIFYSVSFSKISIKIATAAKKVWKGHIGKIVPAMFALFFVWFTNGLWHGASWKYIVYGLYYYTIMMLGLVMEPVTQKIVEKLKINTQAFSYKLWQMIRTTAIVLIGMLIFRAPHLKVAVEMFTSIFHLQGIGMLFDGAVFTLGLGQSDALILALGVLTMLVVSILQEKGYSIREKIAKQNLPFRWILYYGIFFAIIVLGIYGQGYNVSSFIYGQF